MQRLDVGDLADLVMVAPGEEPSCSLVIGHAGVFVADGGGEEFEEAAGGLVAGGGDDTAAPGCRRGWRPPGSWTSKLTTSYVMPVSVT